MSVRARMRRAGAMTLLVHALRCAAALLIASPLLTAWQPLLDLNLYRAQPSAADAALVLETAAVLGPGALRWTGACGALYLLLTPLLTLSWLSAMTDLGTFRAQLTRAAGRYAAGLLLSIATWLAYALSIGLLWVALQPEQFALLPATERFEQLAFAGAVATAALLLLIAATASDLAFAALASTARGQRWVLPRAFVTAVRALSPACLLWHALLAALAASVAPLADALVRATPALGPSAALLLTQALMLGATGLRGLWLALALSAVLRAHERAQHETAVPGLPDRDPDPERLA